MIVQEDHGKTLTAKLTKMKTFQATIWRETDLFRTMKL